MSEHLLNKILDKLQAVEDKVQSIENELIATNKRLEEFQSETGTHFVDIKKMISENQIENIESDNRLLEAIHTTNDRLDFQRDKISKTEEDLYLLKQKQKH
jgi:hypothetical protein